MANQEQRRSRTMTARQSPRRARVVVRRSVVVPAPDPAEDLPREHSDEATVPSRRRKLATPLLAVAAVAALAAAVLVGGTWYDQRQLQAARQQALAAARQATVNFVSISAATVDRDLARIADGATGEFKEEFTRDMAQVRAAVVENKVESRGTVLRAGIVSGDGRIAVVLVAVDATVSNVNAPDGRLSHYRIKVSLARDGRSGRWLVSELQFVG